MPWDKNSRRKPQHGPDHAKARKAAAAVHHPSNPCARCGHPLGPMGPGLHLDHNDNGTGYLGFSHGAPCTVCGVRCNIRAGALKGNRTQKQHRNRQTRNTTTNNGQPSSRNW